MTTETEQERQKFEALFVVPPGVSWDSEAGEYMTAHPDSPEAQLLQGRWDGWRAARSPEQRAQQAEQESAVPDGWKLVPEEPTEWMAECALKFMPGSDPTETMHRARWVYLAMIFAAPQQQEGES